jgi:hypothetical protein
MTNENSDYYIAVYRALCGLELYRTGYETEQQEIWPTGVSSYFFLVLVSSHTLRFLFVCPQIQIRDDGGQFYQSGY